MGGKLLNGSRFGTLWPITRKSASDDKGVIGILASEVAGLMLKVVHLWHSLSDREVMSLKEEIKNSVGIKMLVSDDDNFLTELVLNEILDSFESLARSVARLGKRCKDPVYHRFEQFVDNPAKNYLQWSGWEYRLKKMERKVKKMERFVTAMTQLLSELEVLAELEQTFRRMRANPELNRVKLLEYQKKVMWQCREVRNLRDMSPWNRSHDYVVRLLARSLFTILERIILVFGNSQLPTEPREDDCQQVNTKHVPRSLSFSGFMNFSIHPSQNNLHGFHSAPLGNGQVTSSGLIIEKSKRKNKRQQTLHTPALCGKHLHSESTQLGLVGPFKGCMLVGNDSPVVQSCVPATGCSMRLNDCHMKNIDKIKTVGKLSLSCRSRIYSKLSIRGLLLRPPPFTLGHAALALHYANVIILIEKMASSPDMIDLECRDDLYNMLPTTIRSALRSKLRFYGKSKASSVYDANLAAGWNFVLTEILEWLAPLAHNMIRWHSERNFEKEVTTSRANVLLVQTLYFANLAKTEAAIVELLVGLNHVSRINREVGVKDLPPFAGSRHCSGIRLTKDDISNECL